MSDSPTRNLLDQETSPYLLQHAHNPVHWMPWGERALALARSEDKPVLLSIGYSACHWCHVMAHESFEDAQIAQLMNRDFINIKVDREERPDIDRIYQLAHQLLTRRPGGWPLTVFLDPADQSPFFAGTYFPPQPRHGLPSFSQLLGHIHTAWQEQRDSIVEQNQELRRILIQIEQPANTDETFNPAPIAQALTTLESQFDAQYGGFGAAPKFPHPAYLQFLLRQTAGPGDGNQEAGKMLESTLTAMARGGIYDQLGGGFCRYSVDRFWAIPHFEKMLYDNGQLLKLYAWSAREPGNELKRRVCGQTIEWLEREMCHPQGGLYASLDADSEGKEGEYYVWSESQWRGALDADHGLIGQHLGFDQAANFEGRWNPILANTAAELAKQLGGEPLQIEEKLTRARATLLAARTPRVRPARDDKIIAAWNGLAISGLASCGRLLQMPVAIEMAGQALEFVRSEMIIKGRLMSVWAAGQARFPAYLDDYAHLLAGCLDLLEARWDPPHLIFAQWLAEQMLTHFEDPDHGGFYFTAHDHEALLTRSKPFSDDAIPCGNAVAAQSLITLGHLLADSRYLVAAERTLKAAWVELQRAPSGHLGMLDALHMSLHPEAQLIVQCAPERADELRCLLAESASPQRRDYLIPSEPGRELSPPLHDRRDGELQARLCRGTHCEAQITSEDELRTTLELF